MGLAIAIAFALTGCATLAPRGAASGGVVVPDAWSASASAIAPGALPEASWWRGFGDADATSLVEAALVANTDVGVARANLQRARALRDVAAAGLQPTVTASASAQRTRPTTAPGNGNLFDVGFDASWEPDLFGISGHAVAAAEADARSAAFALATTRVSIAAEVMADVVQLRGTQLRIALARDNLSAQEETLQITRWRQQAGLASSLEVEQARGAVEQTRAQLPALQATAAQTRHALAVLTGQPPAALETALAAQMALPDPPPLASGLPAAVLQRRPDVQSSEAQMQAAAQRVAQADAARRPTVALRASLGWTALTLGSLGSSGAVSTLLASVSQPLFDGGQRRAQLDAQQAAFDAARESYRASVLGALRDVEDALAALEGARQRLMALREAESAAANAALLASQRYASGIVDFQTVLDTQRNRLSVQDARAGAQTDWVTGHVRLIKALGGGWTPEDHP
jgi:NodT family efflux transporter outer membrane factor (OMF) lipoprotein